MRPSNHFLPVGKEVAQLLHPAEQIFVLLLVMSTDSVCFYRYSEMNGDVRFKENQSSTDAKAILWSKKVNSKEEGMAHTYGI